MMDIISGLAAATQAVGLIKELNDIDRGVDESSFKLKIAEVIEVLADTKIALADAKESIADKDREIRKLQDLLDEKVSLPTCLICRNGSLETIDIRPDPTFGRLGHQQHSLKCNNQICGHTETRKVEPQ